MPLSFRRLLVVTLGVVAVSWGCARKSYDGPTVDAFDGRLTRKGEPVSFPAEEKVTLKVILHGKGESFGIPIQPDGTFKIGWMPIGKYSAMLIRDNKNAKGRKGPPQSIYNLPKGFTIEEGQTEYTIDLGPGWKP